MMKKLVTFLLLLALTSLLFSQSINSNSLVDTFESEENLSKFDFNNDDYDLSDISFYLYTTSKGDEVYSYFGHSGLIVESEKEGKKSSLDWGIFAFSPTFYVDFIFGRLYYSCLKTPGFYPLYKAEIENRELTALKLDIPNSAKNGLLSFLNYNTLEENSTYLYHHYQDNCATRIRDIYNAATNGEFKAWAEGIETGESYRSLSSKCMSSSFIINFTLNLLQGPTIDKKLTLYDACFLPSILEDAIADYQNSSVETLYKSTRDLKEKSISLTLEALIVSLIIVAILFFFYKENKTIFSILLSLILLYLIAVSLVLLFMMCFSNHDVTYFNQNIIICNPILIIPFISLIRYYFNKKERETRRCLSYFKVYSAITLGMLLLSPVLPQANVAIIAFLLPIYLLGFILQP